MKKECNVAIYLLWTDLKRSILSWKFFLCAVCIAVMMFAAIKGMMNENGFIWYYMCLSLEGSGVMSMAMCVLPIFPFGISFASEWEQKAHGFWIIRSGVRAYAFSKIMISFLSGFFVVFVGMGLFVLCMLPFAPVYFVEYTVSPYEILIAQGHAVKGILLYMAHQSLGGGLTAVSALCISTLFPDPFVTAASPLIVYFAILRLTERLKLPFFLAPIYWINAIYCLETAWGSLGLKSVIVFVLCLLMGICIKKNIERRMLRE